MNHDAMKQWHYCQADQRWASIKLRNKSMKQVGCLVCCVAMKASFELNTQVTPPQFDTWLDQNDGYQPGNNILDWAKAIEWMSLQGLPYTKMTRENVPFNTLDSRTYTLSNLPILMVNTKRSSTHFVWLLDGEGAILDPGRASGLTTLHEREYIPVSLRVLS